METEKADKFEMSQIDESLWQSFLEGLEGFTDDIFESGREQGIQPERETQCARI